MKHVILLSQEELIEIIIEYIKDKYGQLVVDDNDVTFEEINEKHEIRAKICAEEGL